MFGGRPAEERMVKAGIDPMMARNPNYQMAYGMAGGNKGQADFNYRLISFLNGNPGAMPEDGGAGGGGGAQASMNPAAGLKAVLPGAKARGGKVYRSYKDMDAGAGSGKGRLEKTEIQAKK